MRSAFFVQDRNALVGFRACGRLDSAAAAFLLLLQLSGCLPLQRVQQETQWKLQFQWKFARGVVLANARERAVLLQC